MKTLLPAAFGLLATLTLLPGRAAAQGAADSVRMEVKVNSEAEKSAANKDPKTAHDSPRKEAKTLEITITGKPKSPETRTGHWIVYGRAPKGHEVTVVDSADFKIEFPATGPQKVETKKVEMTFTPEHIDGASKGKGGKKVDASGMKYAGYGIVVKDGDKVIGEAYDPMDIKAEAAK